VEVGAEARDTSAGSGIRRFEKQLANNRQLQKRMNLIKLDLTPESLKNIVGRTGIEPVACC